MLSTEGNDKSRKEEEDGWLNKQCLATSEAVGGVERKLGLQPQSALGIEMIRGPEPLLLTVTK